VDKVAIGKQHLVVVVVVDTTVVVVAVMMDVVPEQTAVVVAVLVLRLCQLAEHVLPLVIIITVMLQ
jgi:hypothetical protein